MRYLVFLICIFLMFESESQEILPSEGQRGPFIIIDNYRNASGCVPYSHGDGGEAYFMHYSIRIELNRSSQFTCEPIYLRIQSQQMNKVVGPLVFRQEGIGFWSEDGVLFVADAHFSYDEEPLGCINGVPIGPDSRNIFLSLVERNGNGYSLYNFNRPCFTPLMSLLQTDGVWDQFRICCGQIRLENPFTQRSANQELNNSYQITNQEIINLSDETLEVAIFNQLGQLIFKKSIMSKSNIGINNLLSSDVYIFSIRGNTINESFKRIGF
jgi:hypothetical protein